MITASDFNSVLKFWFHGVTDDTLIQKSKPPFNQWFMSNSKFDRDIAERFELDLIKAQRGEYKAWESTPRGTLSLIILFDQFSRNIYRNTSKMYSADPLATKLVLRLIKEGADLKLSLIERVFVYMPLMHAEDIGMQQLGVAKFEELVEDSKLKSPKNTNYFEYNLSYARKHLQIIEDFGRFPHRNAILQRPSTPKEEQFLKGSGSSF